MQASQPLRSKRRIHPPLLKAYVFLCFFLVSFFSLKAQNCTINAGVDQTICANATLTLNGTKSGLFQTGVTTWSVSSGPGAIITSANALTTTVTGFSAGTYVFRLSTTCLDGSNIFDDVQVTVSAINIASAGVNQSYCPGTYALAANAASPGTGLWTIVGTNNAGLSITTTSSPTSNITLPQSSNGASTLRWTITQGSCTSFSDVVITNYGGVTPVNAGPDQTLTGCYTSTTAATLAGSVAGNGTGSQVGTWSLISGPNTPVITTPTARNSTVTGLVQGIYILRWTVAGPCVNGFDEMQITVPAPSSALTTANAGSAQTYCDARTSAVLSGNTPAYAGETVQWTQTGGPAGAVITSPTSPVTTVTGLNGTATYTFLYTITASGCTSTNSTTIGFNTAPVITVNSSNDYINAACNTTFASVPYNAAGGSTTQYRIIAAPSGFTLPGSFSNATTNNTGNQTQTISNLTIPGTYTVRFMRSGGTGCVAAYDDVNIIVSRPPTPAVAGTSQVLACNIFSSSLAGNVPSVGNGSWSQVSGPNAATIADPTSNTSGISGMTNGVYTFKWIITGGFACPAAESSVTVTVASTLPTAAAAGTDRTVCNNSPVILGGNTPVLNETGTWTVSPSAGVSFSDNHSPTTTVNGLAANTSYTFTWTISNACGTASDEVVVTTSGTAGPVQANAGTDQCLSSGTTSATLAGNAASPAGASGLWTQVSGTAATITSASSNNSTLTGLSNGTYEFEWTLSSAGCSSTTDRVVITISAAATTANAGTDQNICANTVTLAGNIASVGSGTWLQITGPGGATITSPFVNNSTVTGLVPGSYTFRWSITNGGCAGSFDDVIINVSQLPATAAAGPDQTCLTAASVTMAATTPATGSGLWSMVSGPATPTITTANAINTTITGLVNGVYTFRWTVTGGGSCAASTDDVVVSVNGAASAGSAVTLCNATTTSLSGNTGSDGSWTQISGPNSATITKLGTLSNAASVTDMVPGAYVFQYALATVAGCTPSTANRTVTILAAPTTAVAGINQSLCSATSVSFNANTASSGTGTWTKSSGPAGGAFSPNATTPTATFTGATTGLYTFQWTITTGTGCSSADQMTVNITAPPSTANAGPDQSFCGSSTTNLAASVPATGTGSWAQVNGPNTVTINNTALATTGVSGIASGTYTFRWTVASGACTASTDDVILEVCTVLPVRLLSFTAERKGSNGILTWKATEETAFSHYVVERSTDGVSFMTASQVLAKGAGSYTVTDKHLPVATNVYYRLALVDKDGKVSYSNIAVLKALGIETKFRLYPNPAVDEVTISFTSIAAKPVAIRLLNVHGSVLLIKAYMSQAGSNTVLLSGLNHIAAGEYIIEISGEDGKMTQKLSHKR